MCQIVIAKGTEDRHTFDLPIALVLAVYLLLTSCAGTLLGGGALGAILCLLYFLTHLYIIHIYHQACALGRKVTHSLLSPLIIFTILNYLFSGGRQ